MAEQEGTEVEGLARSAVVWRHDVGLIWLVLMFIRLSDKCWDSYLGWLSVRVEVLLVQVSLFTSHSLNITGLV